MATINKASRNGSNTSVSRNAMNQIENVMRDQSANPQALSSKSVSTQNTSSNDAVRNAASAAAANARITKELIEEVETKCGSILDKIESLEKNQATFKTSIDQVIESIGRLEEALRAIDVTRATTTSNRNFTEVI